MPDFAAERREMVERQIAGRGITGRHILAAMGEVPRELFVSADLAQFAYDDSPLPIEADQTISQPYIVALMIEAAEVSPGERVLEIGAGSGYAAAVMGRIAAEVVAIERHKELAELAKARMARLGYDNVTIVHGDGSRGCPEKGPFEAILAAASGSHVPEALLEQLTIGGTLVMPVGEPSQVQNLIKVTRKGADEFVQEDLGPVRFVPLIGEHGWGGKSSRPSSPSPQGGEGRGEGVERPGVASEAEPPHPPASQAPSPRRGEGYSLPEKIAACAEPLPDIDSEEFGALFDRFGNARVVLMGEASHGTSEFYRARAAITKRLIERHGFTIVAVEADWPDAAHVDRFVRHRAMRRGESEPAFTRFPRWMWRNKEVDGFVRWLRRWNHGKYDDEMVGFFGLDLYNMGGSMRAVIDYLDGVDPEAARLARERYGCLQPWSRDPALYGRLAITEGYARCQDEVVAMLRSLNAKKLEYVAMDGEEWLDAAANARLVANAEEYYRIMYHGAAESWNLRDTHMFETLQLLIDTKAGRAPAAPAGGGEGPAFSFGVGASAGGKPAKAIVWAHNSHIGNAAFTEMGQVRDELNIGQLVKERWGEQAVAIGFGTHAGTVAAATDWDGPMEVKAVRESLKGSYERLCHDSGVGRFLLDLRTPSPQPLEPQVRPPDEPKSGSNPPRGERARPSRILLRDALVDPRLERFIGVIYRPETERWSHYAQAILPRQFDAWVWFDETEAVTPLEAMAVAGRPEEPATFEEEMWPFGL